MSAGDERFKAWAERQVYGAEAAKRRNAETPTQLWNRWDAELRDTLEADRIKRKKDPRRLFHPPR